MTGAAIPPGVIADAVAAAKAWLRVAGSDDDAALAALCAGAIATAEAFCGQVLVAREWGETLAAGPGWAPLAVLPVTAITAVADAGGTPLAPGGYALDIDAEGVGWVRLTGAPATVRVGYAAGLAADWADLQPPIAQGVAMLVAHLFDHRDGDAVPPAAVAALWRPWRRLRLAPERYA